MTTRTDIAQVTAIGHDEAMALQAVELDRAVEMLRSLGDDEWSAQTDCPDWDVLDMYRHVLGACAAGASMRENMHQMRAGKKHQRAHGGPLEAGLSSVQVSERAHIGAGDLVDELERIAPVTVRKRKSTPGLVRRVKMSVDGPVVEKWPLGYLIDTIYLRDLWMHRVDASRATGRPLELTADHDGRIVADVVREWSERHGKPFELVLAGPAGGHYSSSAESDGSERIELDAVEFCRVLAGRAEGEGLLATIVPF